MATRVHSWHINNGPQTLEEMGLKVGDLVTYTSDSDSTGGIIFQIVENTPPVKPHTTHRKVTVKRMQWDSQAQNYISQDVVEDRFGAWDKNGKQIMEAAVRGFVRISPSLISSRRARVRTRPAKAIPSSFTTN